VLDSKSGAQARDKEILLAVIIKPDRFWVWSIVPGAVRFAAYSEFKEKQDNADP
jgi:hypothetical protein